MKQVITNFFVFLIAITVSLGQQNDANISFKSNHHDYGNIKEQDGPRDFKFIFTNTGSKPLLVKNVKPSCGCTTSDYTKQPIPPGGQGYVIARYDPKNRPGRFNKSITVTTNGSTPTSLLKISGEVIPKPKSVEDIYPVAMSKIRITNHFIFGKVLNTEVKKLEVGFINTSDEDVKLEFDRIPVYMKITSNPSTIKPQEVGKIIVELDGTKVNDFGQIFQKVLLKENGEINKKNRIRINGVLSEDFTHLTPEELANAPIASFDKRTYDFGTIKQGEIAKTEFVLTNKGKRDLIIRKIKASCGCTIVQPDNKVIKAGESTILKASFNSRGRKGNQTKNIDVTLNDPKNPVLKLKVKGVVAAPKK